MAQNSNANLWLAYATKLKEMFSLGQSGENIVVFPAPISFAGIAAGKDIDEAVKNNGVYNIADRLLRLDNPSFVQTSDSFFKRVRSYLDHVVLKTDHDLGTLKRLQDAKASVSKADSDFELIEDMAFARWTKEKARGITDATYQIWLAAGNYKAYDQAQASRAVAATAQITLEVEGPEAMPLNSCRTNISTAAGDVYVPNLTMVCSPASASQIKDRVQVGAISGTRCSPSYSISSEYSETVDNWIQTFAEKQKNPNMITFKASDASSSDWSKLGFEASNVSAEGGFSTFFHVTYSENNETKTYEISSEEAASDVEISVTMTGFKTFPITSGFWDPGDLSVFKLGDDAPKALSKPMAKVEQVVMAYGVGMSAKMSSELSSRVNEYLNKARKSGGSASLFGYIISASGSTNSQTTSTIDFNDVRNTSSGNNINIPASNNGYPVLVAVICSKI